MKFFIEFSSDKTQAETYVKIQRLHLLSIFTWIPIAIIVVGLSCVWSNISGQSTNYVNLSTQWQACLTQAQFVTIPLNATLAPVADQITATKNDFSNCIIGLVDSDAYCSTEDGIYCVLDIQSTCTPAAVSFPVVENTQLPVGQLLNALSYIGIQAVIFSALGIGSLYRALKNPTWLPSTIALTIWTLFAIFTYYTVNPILPVPTQTNSTLLILLEYVTSNQKFNDYNNAFLSAVFYVLIAFSKAYSSTTTLLAISEFNVPIANTVAAGYKLWYPSAWFPFQQPNLDFATILYVASFMSILRGYTIQSVFAYKIAFATALIYAISTYPTVVGGLQFYNLNNFQDYNNCYNYFLSDKNKAFFGYPNVDQAKAYCGAFRSAVAGSLGLFITLHAIAIACLFTFYKNKDRDSLVIDSFDPEVYGVANPVSSFIDPRSSIDSNKLKTPFVDPKEIAIS
eukprot:gene17817-23427_t